MTEGFRRWLLLLVVAAGILAGVRALVRDSNPPGDFLRYDRAGALVWRGDGNRIYDDAYRKSNPVWNDRENLPEDRFRYSPALAVLIAPVGALPPRAGYVVWSIITAALVALGVGLAAEMAVRRLAPGSAPWWPAVLAGVPLVHLYTENVKLGQMNCFAFGFSVAALWCLDRKRDAAAGLLAMGAVVAKHIPILLVIWFAWKRRWKAAAWGLGGILAVVYLLPTVMLGPATHHELLRTWVSQQKHLVTEEPDVPGISPSDIGTMVEGQSVKALACRYLTPMPYRHLASKVGEPDETPGSLGIFVNGNRNIGERNAGRVWIGVSFVLFLLMLVTTAPRPGEESEERARHRYPLEAGLLLLTLLLVSPESRNPHFQMMAVTYAALGATFIGGAPRGATRWIAVVATVLAVLSVAVSSRGILGRVGADQALAHGSIGFGALVLFAVSAWMLAVERRRDAADEVEGSPAP